MEKTLNIYICVPLDRGSYEENRKMLDRLARNVKEAGFIPHTPLDCFTPADSYPEKLGKCVTELLRCNGIYLADGWKNCKRCNSEFAIAKAHGLSVYHSENALEQMKQYTIKDYGHK